MMRQYQEVKARHPDAVLFFQLGDFYETFFEDAELVARELEITLTARDGVPMAGVPVRKAELYVHRLLKRGFKVALCPQLDRPGKGKNLLRREVVRVLTPGTVVEEGALDSSQDAGLGALVREGERVGLAWVEAASGEFEAEELPWGELPNRLARVSVQEWVLPEGVAWEVDLEGARTFRPLGEFAEHRLWRRFPHALTEAPLAARAAGALLAYLEATLGDLLHLRPPVLRSQDTVVLDGFTQRSLELLAPLRPEGQLTLFSVLDWTKTAMGRRLLRRWVLAPLRDRRAIDARLDVVEFLQTGSWITDLGEVLGKACDLPRLVGRIGLGGVGPLDLAALRRTLLAAQRIENQLAVAQALPAKLEEIRAALARGPWELAHILEQALVEELPPSLDQGPVIREGYSPELDALRVQVAALRGEIAALETEERRRTGIPTLRVGYNRVFGYYFEVSRGQVGKVPATWRRRQSLAGGERFTSDELAGLADRLGAAEEELQLREKQLFQELVGKAQAALGALAQVGQALAELDALRALAEVARRQRYVRPRFSTGTRLFIREARHPVVETAVQFVPNDLEMGERDHLAVVTGPNMAGKSVFLRQVALVALLAQMGSFVPAKEAELPIFDRIYTRVGASDALTGGLSTFMAEMREAADIVAGATAKSLVILDELGRGTSTHDGMALAWAIARYLAERVRCKTLFATHYRELARLAEEVPGVINLHAAVREWKGDLVFLYRIRPGVAGRSYGIHVAKLAALPHHVLEEAERVLEAVEREGWGPQGAQPLPLFEPQPHPVIEELARVDPERITPLEALELLARLKQKLP